MSEHHTDEDHEDLAEELGKQADELSRRSDDLEDEINDARRDWEAKRRAHGVGTPPRQEDPSSAGEDD